MGLNAALVTAGRSLDLFSLGIQVAGQNISNASTPGYVRDALLIGPTAPYQYGNLVLGTGATAIGVRQQLDRFLEMRIHTANADAEAARAREASFQQLETALQELGDTDLSSGLNQFLSRIFDVVNQAEQPSLRQLAVQQGQQLAGEIAGLRGRIDDLRRAASQNIASLTEEANQLIDVVRRLNPQIVQLESGGVGSSEAGGLRIERLNALNRLSQIMSIRISEQPNGSVDVFTGTDYLVLGQEFQHLELTTSGDRGISINSVTLSENNAPITGNSGELPGALAGRDQVLGGFIDQLDAFTSNLIYEFNRIHSSGEGLKGFASVTAAARVSNAAAALNAAGLAFTPQHGSFQLKVLNLATGLAETTNIAIDLDGIGSDTTLTDLAATLDGVANVNATITSDGRLKLMTDSGYEIRFGNDTSGVLASLGINTFFTGSDSGNIGVNSIVLSDNAYFAAGKGGGPADGSNAVLLAELSSKSLAGLGTLTLDDYYQQMIGSLGQSSAAESALAEGFSGFRNALLTQREQISGVSLDEEAVRVMEFQHAYQSAAKIISTVDQLLNVLMQI